MSQSKLSQSVDKFQLVTEKDRDLIRFIIAESKKYDRWEIFLRAQEQVPSLSQENVLNLYLRYHRVLYPLLTGKSSDECKDLYRSRKKMEEVIKEIKIEPSYEEFKEIREIPVGRQYSVPNNHNHVEEDKDSLPEELIEKQKSRSTDESSMSRYVF